jgi:hypothetical protein
MLGIQQNSATVALFARVSGALLLAGVLLSGCSRKAPETAPANQQTEAPASSPKSVTPVVPKPSVPLTRGDLVSAAGQAASDYAKGMSFVSADPLIGRDILVRVPFGCTGPTPAETSKSERDGLAEWTWGENRKSIKLSMTPADWVDSALLGATSVDKKWDAVEGFWIPRPWLASEACPVVQSDPLQTTAPLASPQTLGLAALFEAGGSRVGRRNGRAYEFLIRGKGGDAIPPSSYRLVLEARITAFASGRAIVCHAPGPDQRPVCIIAVALDRVAFEDDQGATLSEWKPG